MAQSDQSDEETASPCEKGAHSQVCFIFHPVFFSLLFIFILILDYLCLGT